MAKEFEDDDDEPEVTLPDGYGDSLDDLVTRYNTYIGNRLSKGQKVTLKHVADTTASRDRNLTCSEIMTIINEDSNYNVIVDEDKPLYLYEIE